MNIQNQGFSPRIISEKIMISTPKFEGFKYLNMKYNNEFEQIENEISNSFKNDYKSLNERIILSEEKRQNKFLINSKISNSTDKIKYVNSLYHYYHKKKKVLQLEKQISFDEKSANYLFSNENNNNDVKNNIYDINDIRKNLLYNKIQEDKNENDEIFNYDLPLEMDKSSDIFNFIPQENSNNVNGVTKLQEYHKNLLLSQQGNEKNLNKITINYMKTNNNNNIYDNINKKNNKEQYKKYFSFDGENQTNDNKNNRDDKLNNINDNKINMNNTGNMCTIIPNNNNNDNNNSINSINNELSFINISHKKYKLIEGKENNLNKINNKIIKKLISTPNKQCKKKFKLKLNLKSEEKNTYKKYSLQKEKKLINKDLIGYLTFYSLNSFHLKNSTINSDFSSDKKNKDKDNTKTLDLNTMKRLVFKNLNDSNNILSKKNSYNNNNKEQMIKNNLSTNKNSSYFSNEIKQNISDDFQFNNYLNRSRNIINNNTKKSLTKTDNNDNNIIKNKPLTSKPFINLNSNLNSLIDIKNYNKINKTKNKKIIKYSPKPQNKLFTMNIYNNHIKSDYIKSRNIHLENSTTFDNLYSYNTINLNDNNSNKILIKKRHKSFKSIPLKNKYNLIKVNKKTNKKNINIRKLRYKFEDNSTKITNNRLSFVNSTKLLKIKSKHFLAIKSENKDKDRQKKYIHKTLNDINKLKNRIESYKKLIKKRINSYENNNNCSNKESTKEINNKKKILTKSNIDENKKKKRNLINKENNYNYLNINNNKILKDRKGNLQINKYNMNQNNFCSTLTNFSNQFLINKHEKNINIKNNKVFDNKNKNIISITKKNVINNIINNKTKNIGIIHNNTKNKVKNIDIKKADNINIKKNPNKKILIKYNNNYNSNSFIITPSINMINEEIIKYSILRNNQNNIVSQTISMTLGKSDNNNKISNKNFNQYNKNDNCKKTIINVNQYYPNYYINTNNLNKPIEDDNKNITNNFLGTNINKFSYINK